MGTWIGIKDMEMQTLIKKTYLQTNFQLFLAEFYNNILRFQHKANF